MMSIMVRYLDIIIATVFFFSFYSKISQFHQFKVDIFSYKMMPIYFASFVSVIVLLMEFIIFIAFSASYPSKIKAIIVLLLLLTFSILLWIKKKKVGSLSCSCFGQAKPLNDHPFLRNMMLFGLVSIESFLPSHHIGFVQALCTGIGIVILIVLFDISQLVGLKKGLIKWEQLKP